MKINDSIYVLPIEESERNNMVLNITVLVEGDSYMLVDTGFLNDFDAIQSALKEEGLADKKLAGVILTHQDIDHIGSLPQLVNKNDSISVFAFGEDAKVINGKEPLIKLPEENKPALYAAYPEDVVKEFQAFYDGSQENVTHYLDNQKVISFGSDYQVLPTPGHTPGHISLYHADSQTLITGDAMVSENGELFGPRKPVTPNYPEAIDSLRSFLDLPLTTIICYHGGLVTGEDLNERVAEIIAEYQAASN